MKDQYDFAVEYLTAHPNEIMKAWERAPYDPNGCLFRFVRPRTNTDCPAECGCPTMIRGYASQNAMSIGGTVDKILTKAIRDDERIPVNPRYITASHLPIFAEWQRRIDKYYETGILEFAEVAESPKISPQDKRYILHGKLMSTEIERKPSKEVDAILQSAKVFQS